MFGCLCQNYIIIKYKNKELFNNSATKFFLKKSKTVLDFNKMYACKTTFDAIMNETRFLLHSHHAHACSPDAETNFGRFSSLNRPRLLQFHFRYSFLAGVDHRLAISLLKIV